MSLFVQVIWVCILCRKKQELLTKSGTWMTTSTGDDHECDFGTGTTNALQLEHKSPLAEDRPTFNRISSVNDNGNNKPGSVALQMQQNMLQMSGGTGVGCGGSGTGFGNRKIEPLQDIFRSNIRGVLPLSTLTHQASLPVSQHHRVAVDIDRRYSASPICGSNSERVGNIIPLSERQYTDNFSSSISSIGGSLFDRSGGPDIRVERGYQSTGSSTTGGISLGSFGQSSGGINTGTISPQDTSGSGHGSGEGGCAQSYEQRFDHLDPAAALGNSKSRRRIDPMIRNDSMSSDQSESVRPRPPRPHKPRNRDRRPRQHSLSSSDDEIQSTPDCTSGEEHESESISERGKKIIQYQASNTIKYSIVKSNQYISGISKVQAS